MIEARLRAESAVRARALKDRVETLLRSVGDARTTPESNRDRQTLYAHFPGLANWWSVRQGNEWETFEISAEVSDYGIYIWKNRPLEAVLVRAVIQEKNRSVGQYSNNCIALGLVSDVEFNMEREPVEAKCNVSQPEAIRQWKTVGAFKSKWNVD